MDYHGGMRRSRRVWSLLVGVLLHALVVLPAPASAQQLLHTSPDLDGPADFVDLWVINGNAIGNAVGAVAGQMAFTALLGPGAWAIGSIVGAVGGGFIGEWADNKVHRSFNYAAFNRPPLGEPGSLVLKDAGPMEQFLYQVDSRIVNGGNLFTFGAHFGINLLIRAIPGGGAMIAPVALGIADYVAGTIGDNLDGMVDLSAIGAHMDRARGLGPREDGPDPGGEGEAGEARVEEPGWRSYAEDRPRLWEFYEATREAIAADDGAAAPRESILEWFERYRALRRGDGSPED